jgi:hypothetical protein
MLAAGLLNIAVYLPCIFAALALAMPAVLPRLPSTCAFRSTGAACDAADLLLPLLLSMLLLCCCLQVLLAAGMLTRGSCYLPGASAAVALYHVGYVVLSTRASRDVYAPNMPPAAAAAAF